MRAFVVGAGAVGARAARQLLSLGDVDHLGIVEADVDRLLAVVNSLGETARAETSFPDCASDGDIVLIATPGDHPAHARAALDRGAHVVSVSDNLDEVRVLLELDGYAVEKGRHLVVGAGMSPGLSCVLAAYGAGKLERVDEVHVAKVGTGGPACARQHHRALRSEATEWRDRSWKQFQPGSGRELCWFPDPVCGVDCYRAAMPEPLLLAPAFPDADRLTARVGANRRDRLTSRLPMMRKPHPEGELGAIRVEVRGMQSGVHDDRVLGAIDRPAVAAGVVSALVCWWIVRGRLSRTGAGGLASLVEPGPFLAALAERGVKVAAFEGSPVQQGA